MADLSGSMIDDLEELHLRVDKHSFEHHYMVIVVAEIKAKRVLGVLKGYRLSILKMATTHIKLLRQQDHQCLHEKVQYCNTKIKI